MADADPRERQLEIIDPSAEGLLILPEAGCHLRQREGSELSEKNPANDRSSDLEPLHILHAILPDPFHQMGEDFAGGIHLNGAEFQRSILRFHVEHAAIDCLIIELDRWFQMPVLCMTGINIG